MKTAFIAAVELIFSGSRQLADIVGTTMRMAIPSSLIALVLGVVLGALLGGFKFRGKKALIVLNRTLMSLPPVVVGLICYMLFSGVGPLRHLHLLYTVKGMVIAQVILITPLVTGQMQTYISNTAPEITETCRGIGVGRGKTILILLNESKAQIVSSYLLGLGRAFAEVGAVSMVGGAIAFKTNIMTTAIMNYTNMGSFTTALALGIILMFIALGINVLVAVLQWGIGKDED